MENVASYLILRPKTRLKRSEWSVAYTKELPAYTGSKLSVFGLDILYSLSCIYRGSIFHYGTPLTLRQFH